jgi:hypothetical protein
MKKRSSYATASMRAWQTEAFVQAKRITAASENSELSIGL